MEHNSSLSKKEGSFAISNDKILPPKYVDKYANKYVDKFDVSSAIGCAPKYVDKYHRPIRFPSPCEKELGRLFQNHIRDAETHEIICEFDGERFGAAAACVCLSVECHTLSKYSNFVSSWEY